MVPAERSVDLWTALVEAGALPIGVDDLSGLMVVSGRASYPEDASDKSMVHELGLNVDCCAFDKGCYVGQEVINRIDVKGAIQKRITVVQLEAAVPDGAEVFLDGKAIGGLTRCADYGGVPFGLGVLRKAAWPVGTVVEVQGADAERVSGQVIDTPAL